MVGVINTLFFYFIYIFLLYINLLYYEAIVIANIFGIIFSFINFGRNVFDSNEHSLFWRFLIAYLFLIAFYTLLVTIIRVFVNDYIAGLLALMFHVPIAYIINKKFVYIKKVPN